MLDNLKALVVVVTIASIVFAVARPVCLRFMAEKDFVRRRNIWFVLTIAAFVSPNFWLFATVAFPLLAWSANKDPNPLALYVLVFCVIPPTLLFEIPAIGINAFFPLNYIRFLDFAIILPVAWRLIHSKGRKEKLQFTKIDFFILALWGLRLISIWPYESGTNLMRSGLILFLDGIALYFVATRVPKSRETIVEIMATFCLLCAILASLAIFESQRHWLLYTGIGDIWGSSMAFTYVTREGSLRAQVTAGQSIPLGLMLAYGFGVWFYLGPKVKSRLVSVAFGIMMWAGMIAAHARGPWIAAVVVSFTYLILDPNGPARFMKAFFVAAMLAGLVLVSPIGERVIDNLPFIGTVGSDNVIHRQEVAKLSWEMVKKNPIFGDPFVMRNLESLRQGEGIIDIVNAYAYYAMFYGMVGLFLFLGPYLMCMWSAYRMSKYSAHSDQDLSLIGAVIVACLVGFLCAMGTGGFGALPMTWSIVVIGLAVSYSRLGQPQKTAQPRRFHANRDNFPAGR